MPQHESSEWIIATESRVKNLARQATEFVKAHPKAVLGALLGASALGGGIAYYVMHSRRNSAWREIAAAMKRLH